MQGGAVRKSSRTPPHASRIFDSRPFAARPMPLMLRLPLFLVLLLALAACSAGTEEPPESVQESPIEAAVVPEAVVGTYRLVAINDEPLPHGVGTADECEVQLSKGTLLLGADALYDLDVLARAVCGEDGEAQRIDRATSEGPFTVEGFEVRFNRAVTEADPEAWEDRASEELAESEMEDDLEDDLEEEEPDLYDAALFAGRGTLRDTTLTVRVDDLTTFTFVRE